MKKHFNNKGYMLIEIILASVIAMSVAYFLIELTIKLKNKNDDLLVKTLVATDQAIVYNSIMQRIYTTSNLTNICNDISLSKTNDKTVLTLEESEETDYKFNHLFSEYAVVNKNNEVICQNNGETIEINIPIEVKQLPDEDFNVTITYSIS